MKKVTIRHLPPASFDMDESMNVLRTNISYSGEKRRLIVVTSPAENDGKTLMVIQMVHNFAASGQRVLLVDADLRKSVTNSRYGITIDESSIVSSSLADLVAGKPVQSTPSAFKSAMPGLADLLSGKANLEEVIYETSSAGLYYVPIGHLVLNPAPLFESKRFSAFLDSIKDRFDCVVFDSPPLDRVIDAAIIAPLCDGTVIVISAGKTTREDLNEAKKQLRRVNANIFGCILNKVENSNLKYYSKKRYKNYYGGRYGT